MEKIKIILRYIGYVFVALIIAAIIIPIVYKDKVYQKAKEAFKQYVKADVDFKGVDISLWRSFPDIQVSIDSLKVIGIDTFEGLTLYQAPTTKLDVALSSFFGDKPMPKINAVILEQPQMNVLVLPNRMANYDISRSTDTTASTWKLDVSEFVINKGNIYYKDQSLGFEATLNETDHSSSGDVTATVFDLATKTTSKQMTIVYDDLTYIKNANVNLNADINIDLDKEKYTLKENDLTINELKVKGDGQVQFIGDDMNVDLKLQSSKSPFRAFLSMIPNAYTSDFKDLKSAGTAQMDIVSKGVYNGVKGIYPAFDIKVNLDKAMFKYPSLPRDVSNLNANIHIKADKPDHSDMFIDIPAFAANVGSDFVKGKLFASNLDSDQKLDGFLQANVNLENIKSALPIEGVKELKGLLDCDLKFAGKMSDIAAANYSNIKFEGAAKGRNIVYQSDAYPSISISACDGKASPSNFTANVTNMKMGQSDATFNASVENPLAIFATKANTKLVINGNSNYINANEWIAKSSPTAQTSEPSSFDKNALAASSATINYSIVKMDYDKHQIRDLALDGSLSGQLIDIKKMTAKMNESDFNISGVLSNALDYMTSNEELSGDIKLTSQKLDLNPFMAETGTTQATTTSIIPVPKNVKVNIDASIKDLTYTNLNFKDLNGKMAIANDAIKMYDVNTKGLGGSFLFEGLYSTINPSSPDFSMKLDLSKISFVQAMSQMTIFKKLMPIAEYLNGHFNTTLTMTGKVGDQMTPVLSSLNAAGFLETLTGAIKGYKPLAEIAEKFGVTELKELDLTNTKNWFEIVDGALSLKPYQKTWSGIDMTMSGKHVFGSGMDFVFDFIIPKEKVKKSKAGAALVTGHDYFAKEASKYGFTVDNGSQYFVNVRLTGPLKNPNIKITPKTSKGQSVQDAVKQKVADVGQAVKDSITREAKRKEEKLRDTINKRIDSEVTKAKTKAQEQVDKTVDSIKTKVKDKVISKLDTLTKDVISDSLRQKAKDILDKKSSKEVDKIKDKIKDFDPFKKKKSGG